MVLTNDNTPCITDWEWIQQNVGGQSLILREESALLYLQLFNGYLGGSNINVYSRQPGERDNINYHVVSDNDFNGIMYFVDNNVMCSTLSQAVNDMLRNFDSADVEALAQALSNYYYSHNESFDGITILPENMANFNDIHDWVIGYYNES